MFAYFQKWVGGNPRKKTAKVQGNPHIKLVSNDDIDDQKNKNNPKIILGLIHSNTCGYCKIMMPEWEKAIELVKDDPLLSIETMEKSEPISHPLIAEHIPDKLNIKGYPYIFRIHDDKLYEYQGDRESDKMIEWAKTGIMKGGKRSNNSKHSNNSKRSKSKSKKNKRRTQKTRKTKP